MTLIASSLTMQWAVNAVRAGRMDQLRTGLVLTTMLGLVFLTIQAGCWLTWLVPIAQHWDRSDEYRLALTSFYVLSGLHALHVVGGLAPLAITTRRAFCDMYSQAYFPGVQYCAMYWHFLGAVWIILYAAMMLGM